MGLAYNGSGNPMAGKHHRQATLDLYKNRTGDANANWRGGKSIEDVRQTYRNYAMPHRKWSKHVRERADYTCEICGRRDKMVCAHHIVRIEDAPDERLDLDNGICVCQMCHFDLHKQMGWFRVSKVS